MRDYTSESHKAIWAEAVLIGDVEICSLGCLKVDGLSIHALCPLLSEVCVGLRLALENHLKDPVWRFRFFARFIVFIQDEDFSSAISAWGETR